MPSHLTSDAFQDTLHDDSTHVGPAPSQTFIDLWNSHHEVLYKLCVKWLGGRRDEADEAFARTAVRAFENCPSDLTDREYAKAWLFTVARNICFDLYRERRLRRELSLDTFLSVPAAPLAALLVASGDPERSLLEVERDSLLHASVRMLPPRLRAAVSMHYFEELRCAEIARRLGMSEQNVRKCIQLGRDALRSGVKMHAHPRSRSAPKKQPARAIRVFRMTNERGEARDVRLVIDSADASPRQIARAERYLAKYPTGSAGHRALARALAAAGRLEDALPHYRAAAAKVPYQLTAWLELAAVLEALGRDQEAIETYLQGSNRAAHDAGRLHLFGRAAALRGLRDPAVVSLLEAAEEEPSNAIHFRALGETHLRFGETIAAAGALGRAAQIDPEDPLAALLLDDVLTRLAAEAKGIHE
ncbi:MAG TPA: sigma-70 family RNA polymerase sigma factor [Thermoanaerobaculia bacterium]|nr:sigma-70 family RNA polymerase sigma factor [Thermoanaerobaculia bacterium]